MNDRSPDTVSEEALDAAILAAHGAGDGLRLAELYHQAAMRHHNQQNEDAVCFLLTQAYVFALQSGHPLAAEIHRELKRRGRES